MPNHFYRLVLNIQEELNTEDDPCVEKDDYNFQVVKPHQVYMFGVDRVPADTSPWEWVGNLTSLRAPF